MSQCKEEEYSQQDWRYEVGNGDTVLGFEEWLEHKKEADGGCVTEEDTPEATPSLLSLHERSVLSRLASAWNMFARIETLHPDETEEFRRAIHTARHIVMSRPVQREYNSKQN